MLSRRFVNFILLPMVDSSYLFTPLLITLIPKDKSHRNPSSSALSPFSANVLPTPFTPPSSIPKTLPSILLRYKPRTMILVKGQSFSRRKGKGVAHDPPVAHDASEEIVHSESDQSDEEKTQCTSDNECAPFIDLWYDIHPHFLKVLGEYTSPPPGRVWLALCRRDTNTSWAPLASSVYDLIIREGVLLPVPVHFEYGSSTTSGWREWVDKELSDTGFMGLLQRAGVLKAIVSSRCLSNFRDLFNLHHLVRRWCITTHTCFFSCVEITVTLEDVAD